MNPPFQWLSRSGEFLVFSISLGTTLVLMWWLTRQGQSLTTHEAPNAVVSLELAWSTSRAEVVLSSWGDRLRPIAVAQIAWDYVFLIAYPVFLSLSCILLSRLVRSPLSDLGVVLAWGVLCACAFDALENAFMLLMLTKGANGWLSASATICAGLKFALVFSVFGYWAIAALQRMVDLVR
jgi:hypothetical protein